MTSMTVPIRLLVKMDKSFRGSILPLIDSEAKQKGKTRADIVRDVMYSRFYYTPKTRTKTQLEYDYNVECRHNKDDRPEYKRLGSLYVSIDRDFLDLYMQAVLDRKGGLDKNYWGLSREILNDHYTGRAVI